MEVYDEPALEGYRSVSLLLFLPQSIYVATKETGKSSNCSPQEGRTIKVVSNHEYKVTTILGERDKRTCFESSRNDSRFESCL